MMYASLDEERSSASDDQDAYTKLDIFQMFSSLFGTFTRSITFLVIGAALPDLLQITNSPVSGASIVLFPWAAGKLMGNLFMRYLTAVDPNLIMAMAYLALAISTALLPASSSIYILGATITVQGFAIGVLGVCTAVILVTVGGRHKEQLVQAENTLKFLGPIVGSLVIRPFLSRKITEDQSWNHTSMQNVSDENISYPCFHDCAHPRLYHWTESHVIYGYVILGSACLLPTAFFCVVYTFKVVKGKHHVKYKANAKKSRAVKEIFHSPHLVGMTVIAFVINICWTGLQKSFMDLFATFCIHSKAHVPKLDAVLMTTITFIGFGFGSINAIWISKLLSSFVMVLISLSAVSAMFMFLCFWAEQSRILLWISSAYVGFFCSSVLPSLMLFSLSNIADDAIIINICKGGQTIGDMLFPTLIPWSFDTIGPIALMYILFGTAMFSLVLLCPLYLLSKHSPQNKETEDHEMTAIVNKSNGIANGIAHEHGDHE